MKKVQHKKKQGAEKKAEAILAHLVNVTKK